MMFRHVPHPRRVLALAAVAGVAAFAYAGLAGAVGGRQGSSLPQGLAGQMLYIHSHSTIDYTGRRADGLTAAQKYDQGDLTTDSWWQVGPATTAIRIKNVTTNRDGRVVQEELMSGGTDTIYFPDGINGSRACISGASWDPKLAALPAVNKTNLAASGYRSAPATAAGMKVASAPPARPTFTMVRTELLTNTQTLRHVVVADAADGSLYADLVWRVNSGGSQTLIESRTHSRPRVEPLDRAIFTLPAAPACGRSGAAK